MNRILMMMGVCCVLALWSCSRTAQVVPCDEAGVARVLDGWHESAAQADFVGYFGAMDSVSIFVGTDASEVWSKGEFAEFSQPYFDRGRAWSFEAVDRNVYCAADGEWAWFDEVLNTWMGACRGSGVLQRVGRDWKIKHYVLSVAVPNDDIKGVVAAKRERDSLYLIERGVELKMR